MMFESPIARFERCASLLKRNADKIAGCAAKIEKCASVMKERLLNLSAYL